ncbi:cupin [Candidatus Pacearchaeota archaeon]|nr:cupin [Candidatus Pacearchaeota archaeon]|tara:strand:- start:1731 stop:2108 length:378 start_codon:yes stop_codon:yes gene_type:complete
MEELEFSERIEKPWGHELIWAKSCSGDGYVGKILFIKAGHRLSFQYHEEKEETILVKSGTLYLETEGFVDKPEKRKVIKLEPGKTFYIAPFYTHRFMAEENDVELIEVSTTQLEDVVRLEDDYGR